MAGNSVGRDLVRDRRGLAGSRLPGPPVEQGRIGRHGRKGGVLHQQGPTACLSPLDSFRIKDSLLRLCASCMLRDAPIRS